ncbi:uncharacterized protein B0H18DRAFT_419849 [Fomitopsis serialis]|uniref:uncharacterized protein n=1 Tax=Fomitopsis serialis TaxID=139415 RepID=UPI002008452C|nr:uncharacterized protein B0H18DRAFT_419849 [Neoantrodia serialis]KAH9935658.1 hypothetical protein B0H18DRAFT_419849 [Neoantrodia serialis]
MHRRPRHTIPATLPSSARMVTIMHPGYTPLQDLLMLPAYDPAPAPELWGCSHRLALDACRIIANNRDGFLSTTLDGRDHVPDSEPTLTADVYYYFLLGDHDPEYAVVSEFAAWRFPDTLPAHWLSARQDRRHLSRFFASESAMSDRVRDMDGACILSGFGQASSCDNAHLVPKEQAVWFTFNRMKVHNIRPEIVTPNDVANGICLRADIRLCLDRHAFVFFPDGSDFVAYFIKVEDDYAEWFHRTAAQIHERVAVQFLYARFAFNVINLVDTSVSRNLVSPSPAYQAALADYSTRKQPRRSRDKRISGTLSEDSTPEETVQDWLSAPNLQDVFYARYPQLRTHLAKQAKPTLTLFHSRASFLGQEVEYSDDHDFNTVAWHPEVDKMQELKDAWFSKNPQIRQTSLSEGDNHKEGCVNEQDRVTKAESAR